MRCCIYIHAEVLNFNSGNVTLTTSRNNINTMLNDHNATVTEAQSKSNQITADANALKKLVVVTFTRLNPDLLAILQIITWFLYGTLSVKCVRITY